MNLNLEYFNLVLKRLKRAVLTKYMKVVREDPNMELVFI